MPLVLKDRVQETTSITGTGTLTLLGAVLGFQSFSVIGNANTTYYAIVDEASSAWEVGIGTYTASGTTLSRDTVLESSIGGGLVSFAAGTKSVFCTYPAEKSVSTDTIPIGGTDRQVQFNDGGVLAGASKLDIGAGGNLILANNSIQPALPPADKNGLYMRIRAGQSSLEIQQDNGREIPLQESFALNRVSTWAPSTSSTVVASGMPRNSVGIVSTPTIAATNLSTSIFRWRVQSFFSANSKAEERAGANLVGRGNADYPGGWNFVTRIILRATTESCVAFFGLSASTFPFSGTQTIASLIDIVGFGFTNGVDTNWQCIRNDGAGVTTQVDMGSSFPISSLTNVYTLFVNAGIRATSIWVRAVNENTGDVFEQEFTTEIPSDTTFLNPRLFMHSGAVSSNVIYECSGVYLSTNF